MALNGTVLVTSPGPSTRVVHSPKPSTVHTTPGVPGPAGPDGRGLSFDGAVATYADLPTDLDSSDSGASYFVLADSLLYVWTGTAWPADGEGAPIEGEQGPQGRSVDDITLTGDEIEFVMSDSTTETVEVPAITAANASAAAAAASATAADGSANAAADSAGDAAASETNAASSATAAAASADEAADIVASGIPNATDSVKGGIMLAGDLGGTYDAPTVPDLAAKVDRTATASRVYGTDGTGAQATLAWSAAADASSIAQRGAGGILVVGAPTAGAHATTKAYVDTVLADKADAAATTSALSGKADLSGGKLIVTQLPDLAIAEYLGEVANESAMLALTGQRGDWCTRTDLGTDWQVIAEPTSDLANWRERTYPGDPVASVAGLVGAIAASALRTALAINNVDNTADAAKVVAQAAQLVTGRTVRTNLASTSTATFNGTTNITPGVTGVLGVANGGTGGSSAAAARTALGAAASATSVQGSAAGTPTPLTLWAGTQAEYDAIGTKDPNTVYAVKP